MGHCPVRWIVCIMHTPVRSCVNRQHYILVKGSSCYYSITKFAKKIQFFLPLETFRQRSPNQLSSTQPTAYCLVLYRKWETDLDIQTGIALTDYNRFNRKNKPKPNWISYRKTPLTQIYEDFIPFLNETKTISSFLKETETKIKNLK